MKDNKLNSNMTIVAKDFYGDKCIGEALSKSQAKRIACLQGKRPAGYVEIYDENKQLIGKSNIVVYTGREVVTSRMFNIQNPNITPTPSEFICWFGIGTGGCPVGDPLNPISPSNTDTDLETPVGINASDATYADFHDGYYYKHPIDSVEFDRDDENDNAYLIAKISVTLSIYDGNDNNLSEAGLFTAASDAGGYAGNFTLYARITFPTVVKTSSRQLTFIWYTFF